MVELELQTEVVAAVVNKTLRESRIEEIMYAVSELTKRIEFIEHSQVRVEITRNIDNQDYLILLKLCFIPENKKSAGLEVLFCEDSIGIGITDFSRGAAALSCKCSKVYKDVYVAGIEPIAEINVEHVIDIFEMISKGNLNIKSGSLLGSLKGTYFTYFFDKKLVFKSAIGYSEIAMEVLKTLKIAEIKNIPFEKW